MPGPPECPRVQKALSLYNGLNVLAAAQSLGEAINFRDQVHRRQQFIPCPDCPLPRPSLPPDNPQP